MGLENLRFRGEAGKVQGVAAIQSLSVRDWMALELMHSSEYESISPEILQEPIHVDPAVQREGLSKTWTGEHWRTGQGGG